VLVQGAPLQAPAQSYVWRTMTTTFGERTEVPAATGELDLEDRHALRRVAGLST
jgi:hypothetical protein